MRQAHPRLIELRFSPLVEPYTQSGKHRAFTCHVSYAGKEGNWGLRGHLSIKPQHQTGACASISIHRGINLQRAAQCSRIRQARDHPNRTCIGGRPSDSSIVRWIRSFTLKSKRCLVLLLTQITCASPPSTSALVTFAVSCEGRVHACGLSTSPRDLSLGRRSRPARVQGQTTARG